MTIDASVRVLRSVGLFGDVAEPALEELSRRLVSRDYKREQMIFSQGDPGDGLYVVARGRVSISRQNLEGEELVFAWCESGEYFGELALFDDEPRSATAIAVDDSHLLFLTRSAFREFVSANPDVLLKCTGWIVRELRRCTDLADEIALLDVRSRLARRLIALSGEQPESNGDSGVRITQQQLANMLGATRESVNKHLNGFVDEGLVRLERGYIRVVDRRALDDVAGGF